MKAFEKTITTILNSALGMLIFAVSLAAFYLPYEIRIIPSVARVLPTVRYVLAAILVVAFFMLYISSLTVFRGNWALWAAAGFIGVLIFSTRMNGGDMESALGTYGLMGLFLVMNIAVFFRVNPKKYLLIAFILLLIANLANIYTVFKYFGIGMWEEYGLYRNVFYSLVGNYNGGIEYVLPMAICGSCYANRYGKWLEFINYPAVAASLVMAVKCESDTQIITFALILGFMIIGDINMLSKGLAKFVRIVFQPIIFAGLDVVAFVCIVLLNRTNWVQRIGLDPDFHNRRHVWNMAIEWIKANPVWGSGQESVAQEATKISGYAHSHSTYLEVAYKTGFVGSVFMLLMAVFAIVAIYRNRHNRTSYILTVMLFLVGMAAIVETYPMVYLMLCLGLIYYIAKNTSEHEGARERVRKMKSRENPGGYYRPERRNVREPETYHGPEKHNEGNPKGYISPERREESAGNVDLNEFEPKMDFQNIARKVQEAQSEEQEEREGELSETVQIGETVLMKPSRDTDREVNLDETVVLKPGEERAREVNLDETVVLKPGEERAREVNLDETVVLKPGSEKSRK